MTGSLHTMRDLSNRFLSWWGTELAELVPQRLRQWAEPKTGGRVLSAEDGQFVVYEESHGNPSRRGPTSLASIRAEGQSGLPIGLRLPRAAYLVRRQQLPAAARRDFEKILDVDLERATPFRQQDVYCDYFIEGRPDRDGKLTVNQIVVKRQVLDPILNELASNRIKVDFVDCWDDDKKQRLPINLLKGQRKEPATTSYARLVLALSACIAVLSGSAILIGLSKYETALQQLEVATEATKAKALAVERSLSEIEASLAEISDLRRLRTTRPSTIRILDELTRLLPDTAWVSHLRIEGNAIEVTIVTQATDGLLPLLASSPLFSTAELAAPVTFDRAGQSERVTVRMTLKPMTPASHAPDNRGGKG